MNLVIRRLKYLTKNKSLVNGAIFSIYSFINRGFSFVLLMILAKFISPAEYGYLNLWGTVAMVISYFISMSSDGYLEVSYFRDGESGITNTFSSVFFTTLITGAIFALALLLKGDAIAKVLDLPVNSLYIALIISFFTVYSNLNLNLFRIQEKLGRYGLFSCSNALLNFILSIILVKYIQQGWMGRVNAQLLCYGLFGLIGISLFVRRKHLRLPNLVFWKKMLIWGIPLIPHLATNFIRQGCDRYIINGFHSIEDVGLFSFALNLATIISMIGLGFNQSNSVDIYKVLGNKEMDNTTKLYHLKKQRKAIGAVYAIVMIAVVVLFFFGVPLLLPKYSESKFYIPLLSLYALFLCLYYLYTNYLFYFEKTKNIMYITLGAALLHLGLSFLLTKYSLYFTCGVYVITQFIVFTVIRRMAMKELNMRLQDN